MTLPTPKRISRKVHGVTCYPLTRGQALILQAEAKKDPPLEEDVERLVIRLGTGATEEEVADYYASAPTVEVEAVVEAILEMAGMSGDAGKGSSGD